MHGLLATIVEDARSRLTRLWFADGGMGSTGRGSCFITVVGLHRICMAFPPNDESRSPKEAMLTVPVLHHLQACHLNDNALVLSDMTTAFSWEDLAAVLVYCGWSSRQSIPGATLQQQMRHNSTANMHRDTQRGHMLAVHT